MNKLVKSIKYTIAKVFNRNHQEISFDTLVDIGIAKKGIDLSNCNLRSK